jgi:hypothetical protein
MRSTKEWREQLDFLTVKSAVTFLRNLGPAGLENNEFQVLCSGGYKKLDAVELCRNFNPSAPVSKVGPVYFSGGPDFCQAYKGNYLTYIVDCAMVAQVYRGVEYVESTIAYVRGISLPALSAPTLPYDTICKLISALHQTRKPMEHGFDEIGLIWTDYDLDDVEDKLHDAGVYACESCGLWVQIETLDGDCDCSDCSLRKAIG